jgi:hypothetical protein
LYKLPCDQQIRITKSKDIISSLGALISRLLSLFLVRSIGQ